MKILIFYNEAFHPGRPHFHVIYGNHAASFDMVTLEILAGKLPPSQRRRICGWAEVNRLALLVNWARARRHETMNPIDPQSRR